jgi:ABC-type multidrug transport system permease subunit
MKQLFDILAVAILGVVVYLGINLMAGILGAIPKHVWMSVGVIFSWTAGVIIGFWSLFRGSKVLERWYKKFREGTKLTYKVPPSNNLGTRE